MKAENLNSISISQITVDAIPGSTISRCLEDCMILAIQEQVDIHLTHNDTVYIIDPVALKKDCNF